MPEANVVSPPRSRVVQRLIARGARLLARGIYRSVEVDNTEPGWSHYPAILVVNHPTGFSDPALLMGLLERSPRFLAKATLWKTPGLGWFLDRIGAIPIHRAQDGSTANNEQTFAAAFGALHEGDIIAIFPEGVANDAPSLAPIKTGAARLSLGARSDGVEGLQIVPVGIHYEAKAAVRSRAYVHVGDVLDMDTEVAPTTAGGDDRIAVQLLTSEIEARLRASAPDYASEEEATVLAVASEVALRQPGRAWVPFAERQEVAGALAQSDSEERAAVMGATADYSAGLRTAQVSDADLMLAADTTELYRRFWLGLPLAVLLIPFVATGAILIALPYFGLRVAMSFRSDAMTPSTVRLFAAIAAFLAMWAAWTMIAWGAWDWRMALFTFIAAPLYGLVAIIVLDHVGGWWSDWSGARRWRRLDDFAGEQLVAQRSAVVAAMDAAVSL